MARHGLRRSHTFWCTALAGGGLSYTGVVRSEGLAELISGLASPDPRIRDDGAYLELAGRIASGSLTGDDLVELGHVMVQRLRHPQIQARTFAPLVLARIAATGVWHDPWTTPLLDWWVGEIDLRGYDEHLGWLHAVAHGADCVGQLGMHQLASTATLLDAVVARMVAPTRHVWRDQEEDRLTASLCAILSTHRPDDTRWLDPVRSLFAEGEPGPVPANASNTMRTLRSLYVALDHPVAPYGAGPPRCIEQAEALQSAVLDLLQQVTPALG